MRSLSEVISESFKAGSAPESGRESDHRTSFESFCLELSIGQQDVDFVHKKDGTFKLLLVDLCESLVLEKEYAGASGQLLDELGHPEEHAHLVCDPSRRRADKDFRTWTNRS